MCPEGARRRTWGIVLACVLAAGLRHSVAAGSDDLVVDLGRRRVVVKAVAHPDRFQGLRTRFTGMPGYHLLVWDKGRSAGSALFVTRASDRELYDALVKIGAWPGDALGMDTWEKRGDPSSAAPAKKIEGCPLDIHVEWDGSQTPRPLQDLLINPGGRPFDFRFGGHLGNIPQWRSGCGVCLYSCPGSKVGNAAYSVRDYMKGVTVFRIRRGGLPKEGTPVSLIFTLREEAPSERPAAPPAKTRQSQRRKP